MGHGEHLLRLQDTRDKGAGEDKLSTKLDAATRRRYPQASERIYLVGYYHPSLASLPLTPLSVNPPSGKDISRNGGPINTQEHCQTEPRNFHMNRVPVHQDANLLSCSRSELSAGYRC